MRAIEARTIQRADRELAVIAHNYSLQDRDAKLDTFFQAKAI